MLIYVIHILVILCWLARFSRGLIAGPIGMNLCNTPRSAKAVVLIQLTYNAFRFTLIYYTDSMELERNVTSNH